MLPQKHSIAVAVSLVLVLAGCGGDSSPLDGGGDPRLSLDYPVGGEAFVAGTRHEILWSVQGEEIERVRLDISRDGGKTWSAISPILEASQGAYVWIVTDGGRNLPQASCILRLRDASSAATNWMQTAFSITNSPSSYADKILLPPGRYKVTFAASVDHESQGMIWTGMDLAESPLTPSYRKVILLKADDLRTPVHDSFRRFIGFITLRNIPASIGLIGNSLHNATLEDRKLLKPLHPYCAEIFHHGWDHSENEFSGSSYDQQMDHMRWTIEQAAATLQVELTAFGAPANHVDSTTVLVIRDTPEIEAIFFQPFVTGRVLLPRHPIDVEIDWSSVVTLEAFQSMYASNSHHNVLTLQFHPWVWTSADYQRLDEILHFLSTEGQRRFMTPTGYARWSLEMNNATLEKTSGTEYILDITGMTHAHVYEFVQRPSSISPIQ